MTPPDKAAVVSSRSLRPCPRSTRPRRTLTSSSRIRLFLKGGYFCWLGLGVLALGSVAGCQETVVGVTNNVTVQGRVTDVNTAEPLAGALVTFNPSLASDVTDEDGAFELPRINLNVETYTLTVTLDGYQRYAQSIVSKAVDGDVQLNVLLKPSTTANRAPTRPYAPTPTNGSADVSRDLTLRWRSGDDTPSLLLYDVYFGSASGVTRIATSTPDTFVQLRGLRFGESYTWQVAAYDGGRDTVFGPLWSFATKRQPAYPLAFVRDVNGNPGIFAGEKGVAAADLVRITAPEVRAVRPVWSPDGDQIAYLQYVGTELYVYVAGAEGDNPRRVYSLPLLDLRPELYTFDWTPDGFGLVFGYLDRLLKVDVSTGQATSLIQFGADSRVQEVVASVDGLTYVANVASVNGLRNTVLRIRPSTGLIDTIVRDTVGLIGGLAISPSGNEVLVSIDLSGRESTDRRQLNATLFEYDLVRKTRRPVTASKPAGFNDLRASYSADGGFIYFARGTNTNGPVPSIFRVPRDRSLEAELVVEEASSPTLR